MFMQSINYIFKQNYDGKTNNSVKHRYIPLSIDKKKSKVAN